LAISSPVLRKLNAYGENEPRTVISSIGYQMAKAVLMFMIEFHPSMAHCGEGSVKTTWQALLYLLLTGCVVEYF